MNFGLEPPGLKSLQEEYIGTLARTVPPLRSKNLGALIDPVLNDAIYPEIPYVASEAKGLITNGESSIIQQRTDLVGGLRQVTGSVQPGGGSAQDARSLAPQGPSPTTGRQAGGYRSRDRRVWASPIRESFRQ